MAGVCIIPDLSFLNNWVPSIPKQKGKDKKRWGPEEREAASKRAKNDPFHESSESSSEEDPVSPRSGKKTTLRRVFPKRKRIETNHPKLPEGVMNLPPGET